LPKAVVSPSLRRFDHGASAIKVGEVVITMSRIVSLIPSATEIVCALGLEQDLVGRSHECDYPPSVSALPALTQPKFSLDGSSRQLDERVRAVLENALSVYRVDAERLRLLRPDAVVTQSQCQVCAVSLEEVEQALAQWLDGPRPRVVSLEARSLAGVLADIERTAAALGVSDAGTRLTAQMRERIEQIAQRAGRSPARPTFASIEWIDPLIAGGNWMPEIAALAGGRDLLGKPGSHSPAIEMAQLQAADPDIILIVPCGFDMARTERELGGWLRRADWSELSAVRNGRLYIADGNQYFNRPGPRLVESLEILAEILHPEIFSFGHQGKAWRRYQAPGG
jgi:iron complex transport system substrate-binding protein